MIQNAEQPIAPAEPRQRAAAALARKAAPLQALPPPADEDVPAPPAEPRRRPGSRLVLVVVGIVAWLAALGLFVPPLIPKRPPTAPTPVPAAGAVLIKPAPELTISRTFNVQGSGPGFKYVKLTAVIQFADPSGQFAKARSDQLSKLQAQFADDHAPLLSAFNNIMTSTLDTKDALALTSPEGRDQLKRELIAAFNRQLAGTSDRVTDILFVDYVLQ